MNVCALAGRRVAGGILVLVLMAILWSPQAMAVGYGPDSFLVSGFGGNGTVGVYDRNFVFQGYLDPALPSALGLDFTPTGNAITGSQNGIVRQYTPAGALVANFNTPNESPVDVKYGPGNRLYLGTQQPTSGVHEYSLTGAPLRTFGNREYDSVAVLPGGVLWAGGNQSNVGRIDVFNITSGAFVNTIVLDNGQNEAESMYYSPLTNTVLTCGEQSVGLWERSTSGAFIRKFSAPGFGSSFGVTRGPGGDVYATTLNGDQVYHWRPDGTFVNAFSIGSTTNQSCGIVWAGNVPEPGPACLMLAGAAVVTLRSRRRARVG